MSLPKEIEERLDKKAHSHHGINSGDGVDDAIYSFRAGAQALWEILRAEAGEFDNKGSNVEANVWAASALHRKYLTDSYIQARYLGHREGARWQHSQMSAQLAAASVEGEELKTFGREVDHLLRENLTKRIAELEAAGNSVINLAKVNALTFSPTALAHLQQAFSNLEKVLEES